MLLSSVIPGCGQYTRKLGSCLPCQPFFKGITHHSVAIWAQGAYNKNTFVRHGSRDKSFGKGRLRPQASPNFVHLLCQTDIGTSGGKRWPKKQRYDGGSDLYHSGASTDVATLSEVRRAQLKLASFLSVPGDAESLDSAAEELIAKGQARSGEVARSYRRFVTTY